MFQVFADGAKVFDSGVMTATSATQTITLDMTGVKILKLVVTDAGDGIDFDHADWANARLLAAAPTPPPAPTAPTAPSGLVATANGSKIDLAWVDASSNEDGFRIERSTDNVTFTQLATVGANAISYSDTAAVAGQTYYYRVVAYNSTGASGYSNVANAATTVVIVAPAAPSGLSATVNASAIQLAWTDGSSNEDGFRIERSSDGVNFTQIGTVGANVVTYSDSGVTAGLSYTYRVAAYNSAGPSAYSNTSSAMVPVSTALPAPWKSADVGSVGTAGSASYSSSTFTLKGAGSTIGGMTDSFQFASQQVSGDKTIVVRVNSLTNTATGALAGIMFRESSAANSREVGLFVTSDGKVQFIRRSRTGGLSTTTTVSGITTPHWLKLVRKGNTFTAYRSANGTTWTLVGSASVTMNSTVSVGMAVCAKKTTALNTATFDNVLVG